MQNLQALYLDLETTDAPLHFGWLCSVGGRLSLQELQAYATQRLPRLPHSRARATSRGNLGGWAWEFDVNFDISQHVRRVRRRAVSEQTLLEVCEHIFSTPLDRQRPLWELHLVEAGQSAAHVFLKVHRALLPREDDSAFLNALLDPQPHLPAGRVLGGTTASQPPPGLPSATRSTSAESWFSFIRRAVQHPNRTLEQFRLYTDALVNVVRTFVADGSAVEPLKGPLSGKRRLRHTQLPLTVLREIRNRVGGEIREIVLACVTAALEQVLFQPGANGSLPAVFALVPIALGSEQDAQRTGSRTISLIARLPLGVGNPVDRLRRISTELDKLRASDNPQHFQRAVAIFQALPANIALNAVRTLVRDAPVHVFTLQVPGLRERRYLAGKPVTGVVPFAPIALNVRASFTFMTYADMVPIGVTTDAAHLGLGEQLHQALWSAFVELTRSAGVPLPSIGAGAGAHRPARHPSRRAH